MLALVVVSLLGVVPFVFAGEQVSVLSILKASKDAIESYDVERNMEVVHKHYFTTTKEQSVWYHALKESRETFSAELSPDELVFFEKLVQKVDSHYQSCVKLPPGITKAQCFFHISHMLTDLEGGVRWEVVPIFQLRPDKAKLGIFYTSVAVLNAHMSLIATDSFDYYKNVRVSKQRIKPFIFVLDKALSNILNFVSALEMWLQDRLSPANICEMHQVLWKEFEQVCETRWIGTAAEREDAVQFAEEASGKKRSMGNSNGTQIYIVGNEEKKQKVVVMPESPEIQKEEPSDVSFETDFLAIEDRTNLDILDKLGEDTDKSETKFRVQIEDYVSKTVVFEEYMVANASLRGAVMDVLARHALAARWKAEGSFSHTLDVSKERTEIATSSLKSAAAHIKTLFKDKFFPS